MYIKYNGKYYKEIDLNKLSKEELIEVAQSTIDEVKWFNHTPGINPFYIGDNITGDGTTTILKGYSHGEITISDTATDGGGIISLTNT